MPVPIPAIALVAAVAVGAHAVGEKNAPAPVPVADDSWMHWNNAPKGKGPRINMKTLVITSGEHPIGRFCRQGDDLIRNSTGFPVLHKKCPSDTTTGK